MLKQLQRLWSFLKNRPEKSKKSTWGQIPDLTAKKGVYSYNESTGKWEWVGNSKVPGKIAMDLQEYLDRKNHNFKGSWRRPVDEKYAKPLWKKEPEEMDFGTCGCKKGMHYYVDGKCQYCEKEKD